MNPAQGPLLAAAIFAFLPLAAAAQEVPWTASPESDFRKTPVFYRPGDTLPDFSGGGAPYRPLMTVEESSEDRERRFEALSKCALLAPVSRRTVLDVVAGFPNTMIDWVASGVRPPPDRSDFCSIRPPEDASVISRVFASSIQEASDHPFDDLVNQFLLREQRYFVRFQDSNLSTVAVEDGVEDLNTDGFMADQRKLAFDAARKLYFGRLGPNMDDRIRDESLNISSWHAIDYAVAPAMIAGYLYVRGWEKRFNALGLRWGFQVEPVRRILERMEGKHDDLVSAASLEVGMGNFPVKVIVSAGIEDGDALFDFIGIGTSIGKAKQIVDQEMGGRQD